MVAFSKISSASLESNVHKIIGRCRVHEAASRARIVLRNIIMCSKSVGRQKTLPQLFKEFNVPEFTDEVIRRVSNSLSTAFRDGGVNNIYQGWSNYISKCTRRIGLHLILPTLKSYPVPHEEDENNGDMPHLLLLGSEFLGEVHVGAQYRVIEGTTHDVCMLEDMMDELCPNGDGDERWLQLCYKISQDLRLARMVPIIHWDVLLQLLEVAMVIHAFGSGGTTTDSAHVIVYLFILHECDLKDDAWDSLDKQYFSTKHLSEHVLFAKSFVEKFSHEHSMDDLNEGMENLAT